MGEIYEDSKQIRLMYFWLGLAATFAYRIIIVLNFYEPIWVKVAWYIGTIGFIIYFWSRYRVVKQFSSLIQENKLVGAIDKASNISADQKRALSHIIKTLDKTKAQVNYIAIFILSVVALMAGIVLDLLV